MSQPISKLFRLPRSEQADLVAAQGALVAAWARVATRRRGRLVGTVDGTIRSVSPSPDERALLRARSLAVAVNRAAAYGLFRPQCLVRAVALKHLLDARGLRGSRVQVGVRTHRGAFAAHAWVEYGSEVLGDRPEHVGTFAPLRELAVLEQG
jgi:Transglutaminase-like superfamily